MARRAGPGTVSRRRHQRDAEALHAEVVRRKRISGLGFIDDRGQTVGAFFEGDWWKLYAAPNLAPRTLIGYAGLWRRHLAPRLADTRLQAVSPELVFLLRAELEAEGLGAPTITRALFLLQGVLRRAEQWERIQRNPVALVPKPRGRRRRFVTPLPPRGVEKIRRAAGLCPDGDEAATIISLMAYAGLRPQEVFGLTWRDIRDRTLLVDKAIDGSGGLKPTKTGRARTVRLLGPLAADLHEYRLGNAGGGADGLLFSDPDGAPWRDSAWHAWHQSAWHPALKAAGVEYRRPLRPAPQLCLTAYSGRSQHRRCRSPGWPLADDDPRRLRPRFRRPRSLGASTCGESDLGGQGRGTA